MRSAAAGGLSVVCAVLCAWLGWHHPLSPAFALSGCAALAVLGFRQPWRWPLWLLPLIPWIGLMPWTGWVVVEEFDLAVLALAAGGWLRHAVGAPAARTDGGRTGWVWLLLPLALSTAIALQRGLADAGGLEWGWWQGYREPLNSLRLAKPIVAVGLLLPLASLGRPPAHPTPWLPAMLLLLLGVAVQVLRERLAFTGLLNFSSDYRATGPFWEMHVGGAALDGVLAVTLPFAVAALAVARSPRRWGLAAAVTALGLYTALTSFSRIVYLAVPLGMVLWLLLQTRNGYGARQPVRVAQGWPAALLAVALYVALAAWSFPSSGYRGLLALLGAATLVLPLAGVWRGAGARDAVGAAVLGLALAAAVAFSAIVLNKGAYVAYAACWALGAWGIWRRRPVLAGGGYVGALAALVAVAVVWGGPVAAVPATGTAGVLLVVALVAAVPLRGGRGAAGARPPWPDAWRWQATVLGAMLMASAVVGVFGGGAYMGQRLETAEQDVADRRGHWSRALDLLSPTAWMLGQGLGRYPATQAMSGRLSDQTGDHRWLPPEAGGPGLVLTGGKHVLGFGEMFRVSQRIALPSPGPMQLRLRARTDRPMTLHAEVCEKFLLYTDTCRAGQGAVQPGGWQTMTLPLAGERLSEGSWLAPRPLVFSITTETPASRAEIAELELVDAAGVSLLANGGFADGLARWFFSSDRHHMPWHLKNMAVHLLFEQGVFGLAAYGVLVLAALWRLALGSARYHPLAPALAAAVVSLLVVGLVDSLLDMPRIAFLALLLPALAMSLPARAERSALHGERPAGA